MMLSSLLDFVEEPSNALGGGCSRLTDLPTPLIYYPAYLTLLFQLSKPSYKMMSSSCMMMPTGPQKPLTREEAMFYEMIEQQMMKAGPQKRQAAELQKPGQAKRAKEDPQSVWDLEAHLASKMKFLTVIEKRTWDDESQFQEDLMKEFWEEWLSHRKQIMKTLSQQKEYLLIIQEQDQEMIKRN
jgi:hypothetical protein